MEFLRAVKPLSHALLPLLILSSNALSSPAISSNSLSARTSSSSLQSQLQQDILTVSAVAEDGATLGESSNQVQDATAFALLYGNPLGPYAHFVQQVLSDIGTVNSLDHQRQLDTPTTGAVVRPNFDTLYTRAVLDLSCEDVVLDIPEVPNDRFYVFPFSDVWSNQFADLGSVNNSQPGKYLLTAQKLSCDKSTMGEYKGVVHFSTPYGFLLNRILVRNNHTDLDAVHSLQNATHMFSVAHRNNPGCRKGIPSVTEVFSNRSIANASNPTAEELLNLTAVIEPFSPPINISDLSRVRGILSIAGISNGIYQKPRTANISYTEIVANAVGASIGRSVSTYKSLGNDWATTYPNVSGNFGIHYSERASVAVYGYGQLVSSEAIYPTYFPPNSTTGSESYTVGPRQAYLLTFSGKPPVKGFWSLTAYGPNQFFIPNPLEVYALGDRSNMTYPDGQPIYAANGSQQSSNRDGPFQILMQPQDVTPPKNWTNNWLPLQAGGGNFTFDLRWYYPTPAFENGSYIYPTIQVIDAVTS